jgi:4-diphosphocytidyl-2-C-methyl-D-erythritol kinase
VTELISLAAPAKINLSLRILGKRPDGFHEVETLMVPLALADEVEVAHGSGTGIRFTCNDPELPTGSENLCVKAAEVFLAATGIEHGLSISLMKRIPHGAGLGGGSSDAAAVLRGLNDLFDDPLVSEELHQLAAQLGSDVPFFLEKGPAWCRGRGEILESTDALPQRRLLLIKPPFPVPTPWAYKRYAEMQQASETHAEIVQSLEGIKLVNDLETPVFEKYLLLPVMKSWLRTQPCVESAFMSGSGSTMVGIIAPDAQEESVTVLKENLTVEFGPELWIHETTFLNG